MDSLPILLTLSPNPSSRRPVRAQAAADARGAGADADADARAAAARADVDELRAGLELNWPPMGWGVGGGMLRNAPISLAEVVEENDETI